MRAPSRCHRRIIASLAALAVSLALAAPVGAATRPSVPDIEDEVMCPVCGVPLNIADSPQADRERAFIRARIAAGDSKEEIKRKLAEQLGPEVLAMPKGGGFNAAVYAVPIAATLTAALALALLVPRWRRARTGDAAPELPRELSEADARRLDKELSRFDVTDRGV